MVLVSGEVMAGVVVKDGRRLFYRRSPLMLKTQIGNRRFTVLLNNRISSKMREKTDPYSFIQVYINMNKHKFVHISYEGAHPLFIFCTFYINKQGQMGSNRAERDQAGPNDTKQGQTVQNCAN